MTLLSGWGPFRALPEVSPVSIDCAEVDVLSLSVMSGVLSRLPTTRVKVVTPACSQQAVQWCMAAESTGRTLRCWAAPLERHPLMWRHCEGLNFAQLSQGCSTSQDLGLTSSCPGVQASLLLVLVGFQVTKARFTCAAAGLSVHIAIIKPGKARALSPLPQK